MTEPTVSPEDVPQQLEEKDRLIQALTDQLSDAAEQLDRHRRAGRNPSHRPAGSGASGEGGEQQRSLLEKLSTTMERWEEIQPRDAFARVEARLDHLRDLMEAATGTVSTPRETASAGSPSPPEPRPVESAAKSEEPADGPSQESGWEALKAKLMESAATNAEDSGPSPALPPPTQLLQQQPAADSPTASQPQQEETPGSDELALPTPVDFQSAERRDLEQAIEVRDGYIQYLTERLRGEQQRTRETIDWEVLNNAPDELRKTLQTLEADLQERLRIAEVDLSLERARLSRVQSRTEDLQRQIERRLKKRKKANDSDAAQKGRSESSPGDGSAKGWLSTLGLK